MRRVFIDGDAIAGLSMDDVNDLQGIANEPDCCMDMSKVEESRVNKSLFQVYPAKSSWPFKWNTRSNESSVLAISESFAGNVIISDGKIYRHCVNGITYISEEASPLDVEAIQHFCEVMGFDATVQDVAMGQGLGFHRMVTEALRWKPRQRRQRPAGSSIAESLYLRCLSAIQGDPGAAESVRLLDQMRKNGDARRMELFLMRRGAAAS